MRIRITKPGIFANNGEVAIGTELDVKEEPTGWAGRYEVISGDADGKEAVTNPSKSDPLDHDGDGKKGGSVPAKKA